MTHPIAYIVNWLFSPGPRRLSHQAKIRQVADLECPPKVTFTNQFRMLRDGDKIAHPQIMNLTLAALGSPAERAALRGGGR